MFYYGYFKILDDTYSFCEIYIEHMFFWVIYFLYMGWNDKNTKNCNPIPFLLFQCLLTLGNDIISNIIDKE